MRPVGEIGAEKSVGFGAWLTGEPDLSEFFLTPLWGQKSGLDVASSLP